ncbi:37S ribosomal protein S23 [Verticillium alfalfae VaMs.102]|uniref:Small ribosomal subunit protein mS29 n=1 Tax=Verticillium alfalfae (strain VaMs.102 / ATCC MYA-4576 / FGSC 10136) TaxID=526221 RepID=C9SI13_VERA1|nr:37S ribosomal protein S23 [Verticillium alfalfae VaMs.102]EEY18586.1 37S ribosomal protein S23 [Verticillium alfalfae VaMs.102]
MASVNCTRCLTRPTSGLRLADRITPIITWTAPFTTTTAAAAGPSKVVGNKPRQVIGKHIRKGKVGQNSKKKRELSNNNAAVVPGLPVADASAMVSKENLGRIIGMPDKLIDQLRALESFKTTQNWGLFRKPHMLVRKETVQMMERLNEAAAEKQTLSTVLTGERISGKSLLLMQAMSYALLNNWVVIHIPEGEYSNPPPSLFLFGISTDSSTAQDLTNAHTEYSPVPQTTPVEFTQPVYCFHLLQTIIKANHDILAQYKASKNYSHLQLLHLPEDPTLADLITAAKEPDYAWPVLKALWYELTAVPGRPPVLLGLDGLSHIMKISEYRDPSFNLVHSHDLTLVRLFTDALSGKTPFVNGGAPPPANTLPTADPYRKDYDARVHEVLEKVDVFHVDNVSKAEARAVMEYWAASGMLRSLVNETTVTEKWTLGGQGVIGEIERAALLHSRI